MNLTNTCRTCLLNNMEEPVKITASIYKMLEEHKIQQIPRQHHQLELPQSVCFDCYRSLIALKRFVAQCRDAEEYFKMKLEKLQHDRDTINLTIDDNDDGDVKSCEEDDKVNSLTNGVNDDLLELIEKCDEDANVDDDEMQTISYAEENNEKLSTDLESKESPSNYNDDDKRNDNCYNEMIENDFELEQSPYVFEENEHQNYVDEQNAMVVQYECVKFEIENLSDETLLVLDDEPSNEFNYDLTNAIENSKKSKRRFPCRYCGKSFSSRYDLQMHENIHTGIKPFTCDVCGKSFRQKNTLRTHQTLHFGKTIECEQCDKTFARKSQLILHNRMHRNEKPFVCDFDDCDAAYRERQHLVAHQKTHTGVREHLCHYCSSAFYHRKGLSNHVRAIHGNIRYQCDMCERSFNKPYKIRKHLQAIHDIQLEDVSRFKQNVKTGENCEEVDDAPIANDEE